MAADAGDLTPVCERKLIGPNPESNSLRPLQRDRDATLVLLASRETGRDFGHTP